MAEPDYDIHVPMETDHDIYVPMGPNAPTAPTAPLVPVPPPPPKGVPSNGKKEAVLDHSQLDQLRKQGFNEGLSQALAQNCSSFPLRIWIIDNSGSMHATE
jgi:hypothetical protein